MSVELANASKILGQFASNNGYSELLDAAEFSDAALKSFFERGWTNDVDGCAAELEKLHGKVEPHSKHIADTIAALLDLMEDQKFVIITDGTSDEKEDGASKIAKNLELAHMRIDPSDDIGVAPARRTFANELKKFFKRERDAAAERLLSYAKAHKIRKADENEEQKIAQIILKLNWREIIDDAQTAIEAAGVTGGLKGLAQVQVMDTASIGKSQELARAWAEKRAAELVGMKYVNGELVENPNAKWAISQTTRDEIREMVQEAFSKETPIADLAAAVKSAGAFSDKRADLIAATEVANAQAKANMDAWTHTGVVLSSKWMVSSIHDQMDECDDNVAAGAVPLGDEFPSGDTGVPAHPRCRCYQLAVELKKPAAKSFPMIAEYKPNGKAVHA